MPLATTVALPDRAGKTVQAGQVMLLAPEGPVPIDFCPRLPYEPGHVKFSGQRLQDRLDGNPKRSLFPTEQIKEGPHSAVIK